MRVLILAVALSALAGCATVPGGEEPGSGRAARVNAQLGLAYLQEGRPRIALEKLQRALRQDPDLPEAHHYIAEVYRRLGDQEQAWAHYRKALALAPEDANIRNNYGVFLCQQGQLAEALDQFERAARGPHNPAPQVAFKNAGVCALEAGDRARAERYFRLALARDPAMPDALLEMARLMHEQGRHLQARAFLERYRAVAPPDPAALWLGVRVERALGDQEAAARYAEELQRRFPGSLEAAALRREGQVPAE